MTLAPEVTRAAHQILGGDDSTHAAAALEEALHACHPFDEEFEDLLEVLALYAPGMGNPYADHLELCEAIRESPIGSLESSYLEYGSLTWRRAIAPGITSLIAPSRQEDRGGQETDHQGQWQRHREVVEVALHHGFHGVVHRERHHSGEH